MAKRELPSPEVLRQLLRYDPETGKLFWKERGPEWFEVKTPRARGACKVWNARYAGQEALTADSRGYAVGRIFDQGYLSHRVAWAMHYGIWPKYEIDHINGNRKDNRIDNLRDVTTFENGRNKCLRSNNTSGCVGVSWSTAERKWKALVWRNSKATFVGTFSNLDDAIAARKAAEKVHGYHENHGRKAMVTQ